MEREKNCPYCGETIKAEAKKCHYCGEWLEHQNISNETNDKTSSLNHKILNNEITEKPSFKDWLSSKTSNPSKLLNALIWIGIIACFLSLLPYFAYSIKSGFEIPEFISSIGDIFSSVVELIFFSLIAYKIYLDRINKPSYILIWCYVGIIGLSLISDIITAESDEITIIDALYLISTIIMSIILLLGRQTKKIGFWLLFSIIAIIFISIFLEEWLSNKSSRSMIKFIILIIGWPYYKYLESCKDFICNDADTTESDETKILSE